MDLCHTTLPSRGSGTWLDQHKRHGMEPIHTRSAQIYRLLRFLISGALATLVIIVLLYLLTEKLHLWYLASSVLAFFGGIITSFFLQKFWAFKDSRTELMVKQAKQHVLLQLWALCANTILLYLFVEIGHLWYVLAQIIAAGIIAIQNFLLYRKYVFTL